MKKLRFSRHFNWKILIMRVLINAFAIGLTALLMPNIYFPNPSLIGLLAIGIGLGILNAVVKPVLMFLTAQLFFATFGFLVILINAGILYLLDWLFPQRFVVDGIVWALIGGLVLGLVSNTLENLLGLYPPIVPEEEIELRRRLKEESASPIQTLVSGKPKFVTQAVETQSLEDVQAAQAALEILNGGEQPVEINPVSEGSQAEEQATSQDDAA